MQSEGGCGKAREREKRSPRSVAKTSISDPFPDSLFLSFQLIPSRIWTLTNKKNYNSSSNPLILWCAVRYLITGSPIKMPRSIAFASFYYVNTSSMGSFNHQHEVSANRIGKRCASLDIASSGTLLSGPYYLFRLSSP